MTPSAVLLTLLITHHASPFTTYEFRTGVDFGSKDPRAYLEVPLQAGQTYSVRACSRPLDVDCRAANNMAGCYHPCARVEDDLTTPAVNERTACDSKYAALAAAVYGSCNAGLVPVVCYDQVDTGDTKLCGEDGASPRPSMPFSIRCSPLAANGAPNYAYQTVLPTVCPQSGGGTTEGVFIGSDFSSCLTADYGTGFYSCEIVPPRIFVPTEEETPLMDSSGQVVRRRNDDCTFTDESKIVPEVLPLSLASITTLAEKYTRCSGGSNQFDIRYGVNSIQWTFLKGSDRVRTWRGRSGLSTRGRCTM